MTTREGMSPHWESNGDAVSARYVRTPRGAFQLMAHRSGVSWQWDVCVDSGVLDNGSAGSELEAQKAAEKALWDMLRAALTMLRPNVVVQDVYVPPGHCVICSYPLNGPPRCKNPDCSPLHTVHP